MRKRIWTSVMVLGLAMLVSGGCAKKDMVKADEQVPAVQAVPRADTAPESSQSQRERDRQDAAEPLVETPTREAVVAPETQQDLEVQAGALESELQKVYFNFDAATLSDEARASLSKNAELLARSSVKVRIEGHCDERGSDDYNMALGERRAKSARDYLVNLGLQPERLSTVSYGEEKPADPGHDESAWAKNRRADFFVVK